jgi:hypothetical protein
MNGTNWNNPRFARTENAVVASFGAKQSVGIVAERFERSQPVEPVNRAMDRLMRGNRARWI